MALLELDAGRADPAALPDCCARCAATGTTLVPLPTRYAKGLDGIAVPLCPAHAGDWDTVRRRNRVGAVFVLLGMAVVGGVTWELHPRFANPNEQNTIARVVTSFFIAFLSVLPMGAILGWWAKTPIRVFEQTGRMVTLAGVCRRFAAAVRQSVVPAALPTMPDAARFEVTDYQPAPTCPPGAVPKGVGFAALVGAVFGWGVGTVGLVAGEHAAWDRNDWRYFGLAALAAGVYLAPVIGLRAVLGRGFVLLLLPVVLIALVLLVLRLFGLPFHHGFAAVLGIGPLVWLYALVVSPVIWKWRVRSGPAAVLIGLAGPAAFLGAVYLTAGLEPGPHRASYFLGAMALLCFPFLARDSALTPFCGECDGWLGGRRIGAFPRSASEVHPALAAGSVVSLAGLTPSEESTPIGDVEVKIHSCPDCRERGTVVVELFDCRGGGKGGKTPTLVRVGRWAYPGTALAVIDEMFPPPEPPAEQPAPPQEPA